MLFYFGWFSSPYAAKHGCVTGYCGDARPEEVGVQVRILPVGEWSEWYPFGCGARRTQSARHVYRAIREFTVPQFNNFGYSINASPGTVIKEGEEFALLPSQNFYHQFRADSASPDVCVYCGTDCTGCRNGWDCPNCGGN